MPGVVTALIALLAGVQCILEYGPERVSSELYRYFAFIPARVTALVDPEAVLRRLEAFNSFAHDTPDHVMLALDAKWSAPATLLTYALLHANWTHFFVNALTLAAFGAPAARRLGDAAFIAFLAACAIAGAVLHLALHPIDFTPVVGASAAVSGTMAAIARFAFVPGARREDLMGFPDGRRQSEPLRRLAENRQAAVFVALWFAINLFLGAFPQTIGGSGPIAWEAHIGGFVFGLLSFGAFERMAYWRRREA